MRLTDRELKLVKLDARRANFYREMALCEMGAGDAAAAGRAARDACHFRRQAIRTVRIIKDDLFFTIYPAGVRL